MVVLKVARMALPLAVSMAEIMAVLTVQKKDIQWADSKDILRVFVMELPRVSSKVVMMVSSMVT